MVNLVEFDSSNDRRRLFRIGNRLGRIYDVDDLEQAIELIEDGEFPSVRFNAYWILRRYIVNPETDLPVLVATVGSHRTFHLSAFRNSGVELLQSAITAVENGSIGYGVGSDPDIDLSDEDLGYLHDAFEKGDTPGWFTLVGIIG